MTSLPSPAKKPAQYNSPQPVVTCLIRVSSRQSGKSGILAIKRKGPPVPGGWALPGGYVEEKEDPTLAAARELREETGVHVHAKDLKVHSAKVNKANKLLLFYALQHAVILEEVLAAFSENSEVSALGMCQPSDLCFPFHRELASMFLAEGSGCPPLRPDLEQQVGHGNKLIADFRQAHPEHEALFSANGYKNEYVFSKTQSSQYPLQISVQCSFHGVLLSRITLAHAVTIKDLLDLVSAQEQLHISERESFKEMCRYMRNHINQSRHSKP